MFKNVASQKIAVFAYDTSTEAPKTGDAANITAQISLDGGVTAATNDTNPTELDATDAKGIYIFDMTQAETNADLVVLSAVSSTANITLEPVILYTQTVMRGTDSAATSAKQDTMETTLNDVPTTAEFEARTLLAADYVVVGDTIAGVTTVGTVSGNVNGTVAGKTPAEAGDAMTLEADQAVNVTKISGSSTAADNLELAFDGTGYAGGTTKQDVNVVTVLGEDPLDADDLLSEAGDALVAYDAATGTDVSSAHSTTDGKIDAAQTDLDTITDDGVALTSATVTSLISSIWAGLTSAMTTVGSIGKKLADWTVGQVTDNQDKTDYSLTVAPLTQENIRTAIGLASDNLDTQLAAIPGAAVSGILDTAMSGHITVDTVGYSIYYAYVNAKAVNDLTKALGDGDLAAVKVCTDRLTALRAGYIDKLNIGSETIAHTGNAASFKATGFSQAGDEMALTEAARNTLRKEFPR